ncbi:transcriptional repressor MprA [Kingella potus]|uniref:Transcriptional repressor MprA n=1 Tax=Kingella potus TaxID=265175 RepID=A0A377R2R9_9NEIS|nr:MarR family transcriptional regulator [Kingella potus]UOP00339.1 MarR family transcriptional regulator [Kingella potus]STR02603.1 transcriptional repressor MprA [Kingella potus]
MSFSHTELSKRFSLLTGTLPEFNLPRTLTAQLLRVTAERLSTHMNRCLRAEGITESLWYALLFVYVSPNREIMPSQLSDLLNLTRTSATRLSDEMSARGWIRRERGTNSQDRRQIILRLTPEGEAFIHKIQPLIAAKRDRIWADFTEADYAELQRLFAKLLDKLQD